MLLSLKKIVVKQPKAGRRDDPCAGSVNEALPLSCFDYGVPVGGKATRVPRRVLSPLSHFLRQLVKNTLCGQ
jgi:hypothetical protein